MLKEIDEYELNDIRFYGLKKLTPEQFDGMVETIQALRIEKDELQGYVERLEDTECDLRTKVESLESEVGRLESEVERLKTSEEEAEIQF